MKKETGLDSDTAQYFESPTNTAFKSFYMVIGTYNSNENVNPAGSWMEAMQAFLALFFIFFVTIIIMNLITAVAIGDVQVSTLCHFSVTVFPSVCFSFYQYEQTGFSHMIYDP